MESRDHRRDLLASAAEKRLLENRGGYDVDNENLTDCAQTSANSNVGRTRTNPTSDVPVFLSSTASTITNDNVRDFRRAPDCSPTLPRLRAGDGHAVLVDHRIQSETIPRPYPEKYLDKWDSRHVRLPCSPSNVVADEKIWERIEKNFLQPITDSATLERAILDSNPELDSHWTFESLSSLLNDVLPPEEKDAFFSDVLPSLINLALRLPDICTQPIPLLYRHRDSSITLSQHQISCLLANAFLCTFPGRSGGGRETSEEYRFYPTINFAKLFAFNRGPRFPVKKQKIRCLVNYFRRVTEATPTGLVTFHRRHLSTFPQWSESRRPLGRLHSQSEGSIEIDGTGFLQVDFANKRVGGGVLNTGCVQEEIRFVLCPELIVARLFTQCLDDSEALVVVGCERFNSHSGYGDHFKWVGDHRDRTPSDAWGRRITQIVAVDATRFVRREEQYKPERLLREANKVFAGFYESDTDRENSIAVATGNWGCGAYRGDPRLKALLQLLAASEARRDVAYYTFGDGVLRTELNEMCLFLQNKGVTVGGLWTVLVAYYNDSIVKKEDLPLYQYIYKTFDGNVV